MREFIFENWDEDAQGRAARNRAMPESMAILGDDDLFGEWTSVGEDPTEDCPQIDIAALERIFLG